MATRKRSRLAVMVMSMVPLFIFVGCGVEDHGDWTPVPGDPIVTPGGNSPQLPVDPSEILTTIQEDFGPRHRVTINCQIPGVHGYPYLLEGNQNIPVGGEEAGTRFCMGNESYAVGESFCHWLSSFEARFRAIADCQMTAIRTLDRYGVDLLHGEPNWNDYKASRLPDAWNTHQSEIEAHIGRFSGWVATMMSGGFSSEVAAEPFCFEKSPVQSILDARTETLNTLQYMWQSRDTAMMHILGGLKRGAVIEPTPGGRRSEVIVKIHEVQTPGPTSRSCSFIIPN